MKGARRALCVAGQGQSSKRRGLNDNIMAACKHQNQILCRCTTKSCSITDLGRGVLLESDAAHAVLATVARVPLKHPPREHTVHLRYATACSTVLDQVLAGYDIEQGAAAVAQASGYQCQARPMRARAHIERGRIQHKHGCNCVVSDSLDRPQFCFWWWPVRPCAPCADAWSRSTLCACSPARQQRA